MTIRFVPLTDELLERYLGAPQPWPAKGCAMMREDTIVGVFGIYQDHGIDIMFSNVNEDLWQKPPPTWFKRVIISAVRTIARLRDNSRPLYVVAQPNQPNAGQLLEHFGFEPTGNGGYQWRQL